ncbi:MAG TPA: YihY/virulence factor BrkB family protein, partial [Burkholderiales bacterium]
MRLSFKATLDLLKQTATSWSEDYAPSMGAALSYYTLFSIAPLLLIIIGIAGFVFGEDAARGAIVDQLAGLIGADGAQAVEGLLQAANRPRQGMVATLVGLVTLLLGAMTVFGELQNALDRIWRAPARQKAKGWWTILRTRVLSFGMVLGMAFLLTVSLVLSAALAALGKWWGAAFAGWEVFAHLLDIALSFGLVTVMFALIYRYIPRVHVAWHDVWVGAAVTSLLFAVGKFAIGLYLGKSAVASTFGAAGSLVVLILWVYYSAQIFLFGAEFTWVYAHELGSRRGQARPRAASAATAANEEEGPERVRHKIYPVPVAIAAQSSSPVIQPSLRRRHPFGSLGVAFVAGVVLATAKSIASPHL